MITRSLYTSLSVSHGRLLSHRLFSVSIPQLDASGPTRFLPIDNSTLGRLGAEAITVFYTCGREREENYGMGVHDSVCTSSSISRVLADSYCSCLHRHCLIPLTPLSCLDTSREGVFGPSDVEPRPGTITSHQAFSLSDLAIRSEAEARVSGQSGWNGVSGLGLSRGFCNVHTSSATSIDLLTWFSRSSRGKAGNAPS
ncbi:uncharacterized protein ARMOST_02527 [Armillaria ostoyae]|uniref:Uncharacterized protein n=1 Tax=Armillaria ostoyae TaxID=47428 RepID=A0A284QRZ1_ARMOS|nr:uncharacterized protein ARMOST_02527 [Armillaria ostoyae]